MLTQVSYLLSNNVVLYIYIFLKVIFVDQAMFKLICLNQLNLIKLKFDSVYKFIFRVFFLPNKLNQV
jgi:hypothetical protein